MPRYTSRGIEQYIPSWLMLRKGKIVLVKIVIGRKHIEHAEEETNLLKGVCDCFYSKNEDV